MAVSDDDVRHIAALARLGLEPARVGVLARELNGILSYMDALREVDTSALGAMSDVRDDGMPLRPDDGVPIALGGPRESVAPSMADGFYLVPRLATHEGNEDDA